MIPTANDEAGTETEIQVRHPKGAKPQVVGIQTEAEAAAVGGAACVVRGFIGAEDALSAAGKDAGLDPSHQRELVCGGEVVEGRTRGHDNAAAAAG